MPRPRRLIALPALAALAFLPAAALAAPAPGQPPNKGIMQINLDMPMAGQHAAATVTVRYGRHTQTCAIMHCQVRLPYGTKVTLTQSSRTRHFRFWSLQRLSIDSRPLRVTKPKLAFALTAIYNITPVYK